MIIGMLAFLLAAVLILLLIPIRYTVTLVRWRLTLSVSVLCGLWRKEIELPPAGEEPSPQVEMTEEPPMEMTEEPETDWMEEALAQAEEKAEVHERLPDAAEGQAESARAEKKEALARNPFRHGKWARGACPPCGRKSPVAQLSTQVPHSGRLWDRRSHDDGHCLRYGDGVPCPRDKRDPMELSTAREYPVGGGKGADHSFDYDLYSRQASPVETRQRVLAFQKRGKEPWMMKLESRSLRISRK